MSEGGRVASYLQMPPEAVIVSHACAHIGAIQVPVFSGFAAHALAERLVDGQVKVVVTADGTYRRGRVVSMKEVVDEALRQAPPVERALSTEIPVEGATGGGDGPPPVAVVRSVLDQDVVTGTAG